MSQTPSSPSQRQKHGPLVLPLAPQGTEGNKSVKPLVSPKPLPKPGTKEISYYNIDSDSTQKLKDSTDQAPPLSPKPVLTKSDYAAPKPLSVKASDFGIPRSNSFGQSPLSAVLKSAVVASAVKRSSSMEENLHSAAQVAPLEKSALVSENRCVSPRLSSRLPSTSKPLSSSSTPSPTPSLYTSIPTPPAEANGTNPLDPAPQEERKETTLNSFFNKRHQDLPLQIKVNTGYMGEAEFDAISAGDVFTLHFLKHSEVIEVERPNQKYYIPLNSAIKARIPYQGSMDAYNFTVSELLTSSEPPLLIKAVTGHQQDGTKNSVDEDEIFVLEGTKIKTLSRFLQVFSLTHQISKKLKGDCSASFTTNAAIYVSDIAQRLSSKFPLKAVLYLEQSPDPYNLSSSEVTLLKRSTRTSIIASAHQDKDDNSNTSTSTLVELPLDLGVTVLELPLDGGGKTALCTLTRKLLDTFDSSQVTILCSEVKTVNITRKGHERLWYKLEVPASLKSSAAALGSGQTETEDEDDPEPYEDLEAIYVPPVSQGKAEDTAVVAPPTNLSGISVQVNAIRRSMENMQSQTNAAERMGRDTRTQIASLRTDVTELKGTLAALGKTVASLAQQMESLGSGGMLGKSASDPAKSADTTDLVPLASLDITQVLGLLKSMGLEQYEEVFSKEQITGEILAECNEEVLERELHIPVKIHRIRLMKVIKQKAVPNLI